MNNMITLLKRLDCQSVKLALHGPLQTHSLTSNHVGRLRY